MSVRFKDSKYQKERVDLATKCLIDNGIETDEAETVLEALCYILMDEEIESFFDDEKQDERGGVEWISAEEHKPPHVEGAEILAVVKEECRGEVNYTVDLLEPVRWMGRTYFKDPYDGNYEVRPSDIVAWTPKPTMDLLEGRERVHEEI